MAYMYGLFRDCGIPIMLHKYPEYTQTLMKANTGLKLAFTSIEDASHDTNHTIIGYTYLCVRIHTHCINRMAE